MSELKVNKISPRSGTAITLGDSGDTFTIPSGATLAIAGSVTGFTSAGIDDNATSVAITIDSSERVAIGNTSPAEILSVSGNMETSGSILSIANNSLKIISGGNATNAGSNLTLYGGTNADAGVFRFRSGTTERMRIDASGDLGIGTSAPKEKLDSRGAAVFSGDHATSTNAYGTTHGILLSSTSNLGKITAVSNGSNDVKLELRGLDGGSANSNQLVLDGGTSNVGIGTSSPASLGSNITTLEITGGSTVRTGAVYLSSSDKNIKGYFYGSNTGFNIGSETNHSFKIITNNTEIARFDASGDLLIGKTSISTNAVGVALTGLGLGAFTRSGDAPIIANRTTSDGDIALFRKDNSTVGSIATVSGTVSFGQSDTALVYDSGNDQIRPYSIGSGTRDNAIDLGSSSGRFKDIYLGGGVYLGGTGSANKLTDYEEGTFTPTIESGFNSGVTYAIQGGKYTKIGNKVFLAVRLEIGTGTGNSSRIEIGGLPFTTATSSSTGLVGSGVFSYTNVNIINSTTTNLPTIYFPQNVNQFGFYKTNGTSFNGNDLSTPTDADFYLSAFYFTDA